ncbi:MAG: 23S rRNA (guanosine(2251)-2'-O)-methyltransferase RlmB [Clostridiales bacterium]|nr:23S rRNA (guanosine(2251)-2'-O)-methyltransferase RlmB [Clostridiales bacterium]
MRNDQDRRGFGRRTWPAGNAPRTGRVDTNIPPARRADDEERDPKKRNEARRRAYERTQPAPIEVPEGIENGQLLAGRNPIREAFRAGRPIEKLLVAEGDLSGAARDIVRMARDAGTVVQTVDRTRLDQIYPAHQGMLAYVAAVPYVEVDEMLADAAEKGEPPFLVLLDGITDPHNLGAIIRTAECAGAHGVVLPERRAAGLTPAAAKAAAGALNHMKVARVTNLNRTIDGLKERGLWIIGTTMDGSDAFKADLTGPVALVIGSEGDGISQKVMEKCDLKLTLPMAGQIDSLNASVAAGILMYEIVRARRT